MRGIKTHVLQAQGYVLLDDYMGDDLKVVRAARVSHDAVWRAGKDAGKDEKLIRFLLENGHTSPFEHNAITFEVKAPIFVFRQWHRHRTQSYNEVSARYTALPDDWYVPAAEQITLQSKTNHQSRTVEQHPYPVGIQLAIDSQSRQAHKVYRDLLADDCPRELARSVLPVNTMSKMFATANLLNWMRFLGERLEPGAQYEVRVYAEAIRDFLKQLYPVCMEAFEGSAFSPQEEQ